MRCKESNRESVTEPRHPRHANLDSPNPHIPSMHPPMPHCSMPCIAHMAEYASHTMDVLMADTWLASLDCIGVIVTFRLASIINIASADVLCVCSTRALLHSTPLHFTSLRTPFYSCTCLILILTQSRIRVSSEDEWIRFIRSNIPCGCQEYEYSIQRSANGVRCCHCHCCHHSYKHEPTAVFSAHRRDSFHGCIIDRCGS